MDETNQTPIEQNGEERNQLLLGYGLIFHQLLESEKFRMFVETYFTIQRVVNDEEKSIELRVIENPPEVIAQKVQGAITEAKEALKPRKRPLVELADNAKADRVIAKARAKGTIL